MRPVVFSNRVADYVKYRPGYPDAVAADLLADAALPPHAVVADIGSGTGLLTELFLRRGMPVFGVEPNPEMRIAGAAQLHGHANFRSINGTAEATTLPSASVDLITAGQAFHWFDRPRTKLEFVRIARQSGWVALIWNERQTETTPFAAAYEALLQTYATDYREVDHRRITDEVIAAFFQPASFRLRVYPHRQRVDWSGLRGRVLSSSYAPLAGHSQHEPMIAALRGLFERYQQDGHVLLEYQTKVYAGPLFKPAEDHRV